MESIMCVKLYRTIISQVNFKNTQHISILWWPANSYSRDASMDVIKLILTL